MAKVTPSMAKNKMRRCLTAISDPYPSKTKIDQLWEYFDSSCTYCGKSINRASRTGHLDHLVPAAEGASNSIHNHTLACATCNGDEKREEAWLTFLERKAENEQIFVARRTKLEHWLNRDPKTKIDMDIAVKAQQIIEEAIKNFEDSVEAMRSLRQLDNQ